MGKVNTNCQCPHCNGTGIKAHAPAFKPGDVLTGNTPEEIRFMVVLISSDKERDFESASDIWRCASYQVMLDGSCLGGQIVLYNESELSQFGRRGLLKLSPQQEITV